MKFKTHPNWLALVLLIALPLAGFYFEATADLTQTGHILVEIGLLFLLYGVVLVWLKANETAMVAEDRAKYRAVPRRQAALARSPKQAGAPVNITPVPSSYRQPGWPAYLLSAAWCTLAAIFHRFSRFD